MNNPVRASVADRLAFVDALRGYAIAGVLLYHCWCAAQDSLPGLNRGITILAAHGRLGVQLFFVVSAFTLCNSIAAGKRRGDFSLGGFFANRCLRILPLYWLALIGYSNLRVWDGGAALGWKHFLACAFFVNWLTPATLHLGVPGGWSVVCEIWFYAMLPFLAARIKDGAAALNALLIVLCARAGAYAWLEHHPLGFAGGDFRGWLVGILPNQLPVFMAGIVFFHLHCGGARSFSRSAATPAWLGFGAYLLAARMWNMDFLLPVEYLFTAGFFAIAWALAGGGAGLLVNRAAIFTGKVSYSVYICHFLAVHYAAVWLLPRLMRWDADAAFAVFCAGGSLASIGLAWALHKGIEVPAQRAGRKWLERRRATRLP